MVELDTYVYNNAETEGLKHLAAIFKDAFVVLFSFWKRKMFLQYHYVGTIFRYPH